MTSDSCGCSCTKQLRVPAEATVNNGACDPDIRLGAYPAWATAWRAMLDEVSTRQRCAEPAKTAIASRYLAKAPRTSRRPRRDERPEVAQGGSAPYSTPPGGVHDLPRETRVGRATRAKLAAHPLRLTLKKAGGNRTEAAALLGLNRTTLVEKLRKYAA